MAKRGVIRVATCQFATGGGIRRNGAMVRRQMAQAADKGADVVHFPECALSGYAGMDFEGWSSFDWDALKEETLGICAQARERGLWVVLGSSHRLSGKHRPHNCLYAIDPRGRIVDRYDKRFCTDRDLKHYSPGEHLAVFEVNGVRCGMLICYDVRFPELYRACGKRGVECMFHSFYNARHSGPDILTLITRSSVQTRAASNYMWISATNACGHYQCWPSVFVQPDGRIAASLKRNRAGVMVNKVDTNRKLYDASGPYRERAMRGTLHSGRLVADPRSRDRQSL